MLVQDHHWRLAIKARQHLLFEQGNINKQTTTLWWFLDVLWEPKKRNNHQKATSHPPGWFQRFWTVLPATDGRAEDHPLRRRQAVNAFSLHPGEVERDRYQQLQWEVPRFGSFFIRFHQFPDFGHFSGDLFISLAFKGLFLGVSIYFGEALLSYLLPYWQSLEIPPAKSQELQGWLDEYLTKAPLAKDVRLEGMYRDVFFVLRDILFSFFLGGMYYLDRCFFFPKLLHLKLIEMLFRCSWL